MAPFASNNTPQIRFRLARFNEEHLAIKKRKKLAVRGEKELPVPEVLLLKHGMMVYSDSMDRLKHGKQKIFTMASA